MDCLQQLSGSEVSLAIMCVEAGLCQIQSHMHIYAHCLLYVGLPTTVNY